MHAPPEAEDAMFHKAYCYYTLAKNAPRDEKLSRRALSALTTFTTRYKMSAEREQAEKYMREMKTHLSDMYYNRALFYDKRHKPEAAIITYENFLRKFPASDKAQDVYARIKFLESTVKRKQASRLQN